MARRREMPEPAPSGSEPMDLLITGGTVLTMNADRHVFHPGSVAVAGNRIVAAGPSATVDACYRPRNRIDADGHIVMPGLVSCHGHACNSLVRGMAEDRTLHEWLNEVLWPAMSHAGPDEVYWGSMLSAVELLRAGVTCFADMWTEVPATARAVDEVGLRALLAHNLRDFGDSERTGIELERGRAAWRTCDGMGNGRIRIGMAPHSIYACTPEMLRGARAFASEHGLWLQIHIAETQLEFEQSRQMHGLTPIGYLDQMGFLGPDVIGAHVVWLGEGDLDILRGRSVNVAHCVASNLKLGSGVSPVTALQGAGLHVGLGTDGPASNNALDILADMKIAALLQKGVGHVPKAMPAAEVVAMATCDGAAVLGLGAELGRIAEGFLADVILVDVTGAHTTPFHPGDPTQAYAHLVYCSRSSDVRTVIVDGQVRMRDATIEGLDEKTVLAGAQRASTSILTAAGLLADGPPAPKVRYRRSEGGEGAAG